MKMWHFSFSSEQNRHGGMLSISLSLFSTLLSPAHSLEKLKRHSLGIFGILCTLILSFSSHPMPHSKSLPLSHLLSLPIYSLTSALPHTHLSYSSRVGRTGHGHERKVDKRGRQTVQQNMGMGGDRQTLQKRRI